MKKIFIPTVPATPDEIEVFQNAAHTSAATFYDPKAAFLRDALQLAQEELNTHENIYVGSRCTQGSAKVPE